MKKIILGLCFLGLAQWSSAQVDIGVRIGINAGLFELENDNVEGKHIVTTPRSNLIVNMEVDMPFSLEFSFRTGLGFVQKWSEIDRTKEMQPTDTMWTTLYRMSYLEVPLFLVARAETDAGNFYFGAGPTLSMGVGGQVSISKTTKTATGTQQDDVQLIWNGKQGGSKLQDTFNRFSRFDLGLGAILAYRFPNKGITFTLTYNKGLTDISPYPDIKFKTSYVGLSIGFAMQN